MHKYLRCALGGLLAGWSALAVPVAASAAAGIAAAPAALMAQAKAQGTVRVIVGLAEPMADEATLSTSDRQLQRTRLATSQRRALAAAGALVQPDGALRAGARETSLFITPGYRFAVVDLLLTNFHLPRSTLLMLVAAFAGRERMLAAYAWAVAQHLRFFSYGDACLIARAEDPIAHAEETS